MKRKILSVLLTGFMAVTLLSGCAGGGGTQQSETENQEAVPTDKTGGKVELKVWAEEATFDALNQMVDSFKEEYKGQADFEITLEQNVDSYTKDNVLADVHNAADVFVMVDDQVASLAAAGALYPVPNVEEVKAANVEKAVDSATINEVMYAYPMTADNGYFLYYNKKYYKDSDITTLDNVLQVAADHKKKVVMDWGSGWYLYSFFGHTGLDFGINEDGVTNHCDWNSTKGDIKGVDIASAMLKIASNPGFANMSDGDFIAGAQKGTVIAGVSGVWDSEALKKAWGSDLGAVKLPTYTVADKQVQMASFSGCKLIGVSAYSKNLEWAAKLADWLTNEQNQTLRFQLNGQGPSNIKAAESDAVKTDVAIQAVIAQSEYGELQRVGNSYWDATSVFGNVMGSGNPEHKKLQQLMDDLVAGITKSVAE